MSEEGLQQHALELATELLGEIELSTSAVSQQVRKGARLARIVGDAEASKWLRYELYGIPNDADGRAHMTRTRRWTRQEESKGYWGPIADAESSMVARKSQLTSMQVDSFAGDMMLPTSREHRLAQNKVAGMIEQQARIVNRVAALLHEFVSRTYYELLFSAEQRDLFERARREIDALLGPTSGRALEQIDAIYRRLAEGDREAVSQAMTTCRRLIDEFADAVFPPSKEPVVRDGQTIDVGANRTQNRINEYFAGKVPSTSRRRRVKRALSDIYDRVSTGVHKEVTADEARFLFLATYTLLGEVLAAEEASAPE